MTAPIATMERPGDAGPSAATARARRRRGARAEDRRARLGRRLGLVPTTQDIVDRWLDASIPPAGNAAALDAGCGRLSQLRPFKPRLSRLVGVDIHEPARPLEWLDEFRVADLCADADAFDPRTFDVALSNFTVEHFANPIAAFRIVQRWLKPGGWLVITTVNRAHPFVDAYLTIPSELRGRLQPVIKRSAADAHPLVGACNTPALVRRGLEAAGYTEIEILTTDHLARAWRRTLPTWGLGLIGDLAAHSMPARRSTIVARARRPTV